MEAPKSIAHEIGGAKNDALRFGLHGVRSNIVGSHPLESSCQSMKETQEQMKRKFLANTYGSAFPLKMDLDMQILSRSLYVPGVDFNCAFDSGDFVYKPAIFVRFQRPPGAIPSSMLGLEALTGSLDDFGFEDYLNDPRESEVFRPVDMHHGMEVRLGLSKGPVCPSFM
ncbi:hypothetical protein FEM48_Zijuj04G0069400 [Ziziphus jujuba var. spinosa]|uniref:Cyclin-B1-2-like n=1 Tax=Ziziphus jujuba var. spinosa TaxID=714518 RepID=A0A978VIG0_ZIZJJ|nr:hypothetical protein FEM48_Zijuj04G0069400 [Ziziphus jujuba var. spinosa]